MTTREELDVALGQMTDAARRSARAGLPTPQWREACADVERARARVLAIFDALTTTKERNGNEEHPQG